ncbi:MAG: hypothetical protein RBT57_01360 [Paludibacter sp.]|jgi:hypothetical protein|nr:hypothetical protein [Paludibacter sp.]
MKKITFMYAMICIASVLSAQTVVTNWSYTNAGGNPPLSPANNATLIPMPPAVGSTRNIAAGVFNGNDRMFVFTRVGATQVLAYETAEGTLAASLNVTGVSGGLVAIGDGDVTTDGKLLMCNVADTGKPFKVYQWDNETDAPKLVINWTVDGVKERYGDKALMTGSIADGTAKVYSPNKKLGYAQVMCWSMIPDTENPGSFKFNNVPAPTVNVFGNSTQPSVAVTPEGGYYYKDAQKNLSNYAANGDSISEGSTSVIRVWAGPVKYIYKDGNDDIIAYFKYRSAPLTPEEPVQELVEILRVPNGNLAEVSVIAATPSLGPEYNLNGWNDFVARKVGNDIEVFAFSTTNGFAMYTIQNLNTQTSSASMEDKIKLTNTNGSLRVDGIQATEVEIFNIMGHRVHHVLNSSLVTTSDFKGMHLVRVKAGDVAKTFKMAF